MYAPQPNIPTATKYFLDALNTGEAQLKTADGADTVFAQKMQQGIAQGVPQTQGMQGAKQDYAAAAPSVVQKMKQDEVQRMMQQAMQPQPVGIEQLPAQNMQGMQKMAGGGVVGYAGPDGSLVDTKLMRMTPEEYERKRREAMARGAPPERIKRTPEEEAIFGALSTAPPMQDIPVPEVVSAPFVAPEAQRLMDMQRPPAPRPPAPRPPAAPAAPAAPQRGIAQLAAPTAEEAMATARSGLGLAGTGDLRDVAEEGKRLRAARPPAGVQTLEALRKEREMSQQQYEAANKAAERGGIMAFLQGMASGTLGGGGRGYEGFAQSEAGRKKAFAAEETLRASKVDAINDANAAAKIGDHDKYMEARTKIADIDRQIAQIEATYAGNILQSRANVYGTDVTARERGLDRAQQASIEGARLKQQAEQNNQMALANRINAANSTVAGAYSKLQQTLEKDPDNMFAKMVSMAPDMLKDPANATRYQAYKAKEAKLYTSIVEPAEMERNRLAAMVGGGNVQRYDAQGKPIK